LQCLQTAQYLGRALAGHNGMPLAGARYTLKANQKAVPKELTAFGARLLKEATKVWRPPPPPDAGTRVDAGTAGRHPSP
jgi:hypothetical protein